MFKVSVMYPNDSGFTWSIESPNYYDLHACCQQKQAWDNQYVGLKMSQIRFFDEKDDST